MEILIVALGLVLISLWYAGLYYNCSYFKKEREKKFVILKELLNRRCELMASLAESCHNEELAKLCDEALSESDIENRIQLESKISKAFIEFDNDNSVVMGEALYRVQDSLIEPVKEFNVATDIYNKSVSNFLIRLTAKVANLLPGKTINVH